PAAPGEICAASLAWDWPRLTRADLGRLVHAYGTFLEANSGVQSPYKDLFATLFLTHRSAGQIRLNSSHSGELPAPPHHTTYSMTHRERATKKAGRAAGSPPRIERIPWLLHAQNMNASGPAERWKFKSAYMIRRFPDGQIDVLWDFLTTDRYRNSEAALKVNT